jgi:hypothetical protein
MPSITRPSPLALRRKKVQTVSVNQILLVVTALACLIAGLATVSSAGHLTASTSNSGFAGQNSSPLQAALQTSQTTATLKPLRAPDTVKVEILVEKAATLKSVPDDAVVAKEVPAAETEVVPPLRRPVVQKVPNKKDVAIKSFPGAKSIVAYAISITSCAANATTVFDGPAILSHSIHEVSIRHDGSGSKYDYKLYAFVHPDATRCTDFLEYLGYEVLIRDLPFNLNDIQSENYKSLIEQDGCCGSREFLKLWAFALVEHDIVVHTDTDVLFLQPMDTLFDAMLDADSSKHTLATMGGAALPSEVDFVYTRDYLQRSRITRDPKKFGVQGGFFVAKPSQERMDEMVKTILRGDYERGSGWGNLQYGGYWGSPQIQGFLSYFYGEIRPEHAVELNRCLYNTMVDDPPEADGRCRTGEETCEDCRETPLVNMINVHLTTCWKPWHVRTQLRT